MNAVRVNEKDNVAVALKPLNRGEAVTVGGRKLILAEDIPQGHKFALAKLPKGSEVMKYGYPIGILLEEVVEGAWIHTHNLKTKLDGVRGYDYKPELAKTRTEPRKTFSGYRRPDGKVGIRNEIWIIPTVGCVNSVARRLASEMNFAWIEGVDGFYAFEHPYGCSQMSEDQENTKRILVDFMEHPNAAAVLVLGLGCENCSIDSIKKLSGKYEKEERIAFLECQGVPDEIEYGKSLLKKLADYAAQFQRTEVPLSELIVGLKCGGSDGLSGITANPLVGCFSDRLIAMGGSTILTEVPEMFGAETLLMNRCEDKETFDKLVPLINDYKEYYRKHDQVIYENPSPGNKEGGISTLEDKSLGCIQKGGSSNVRDVLKYGEKVSKKGLSILSSPGNDLVASTALASAGAHLILFTTGRGTPFGSQVPTIKISTNTKIFENKPEWIDFNAGELVEGKELSRLTEELTDYIIEVASGRETKAEENGYRDFAIFKTGVTL